MAGKHPRKNAIGVAITVTLQEDGVALNISNATTKNFVIEKPSGTVVTKTASFVTNGTDGKLRYSTISGDLNESGRYRLQVDLEASPYDGLTDIGSFFVEDNIQ